MSADADFAWHLVDHLAPHLEATERIALYVSLGGGNHFEATIAALLTLAHKQILIPMKLAVDVEHWFRRYKEILDEQTVQLLAGRIRARIQPR